MSLPLYLRGCGFPRQLMFFVFRVEGSEREGFLQVLLAPQTKLRGRGRSVRGEEYVNMWFCLVGSQNQRQLIICDIQLSTPALLIGPLNSRKECAFAISLILPVVGCQVALWAWQPSPVRLSQTAPLPRLPRGWLV